MKNGRLIYLKPSLLIVLLFAIMLSCERDPSDQVAFATNDKTGEIFIDAPIGMGTDFYFPFLGSKPTAWTVDDSQGYDSQSSMRFDVPNANDPGGSYAGAIFRTDGAGRDLTEYDALTFWAKASQGVTISQLGFGQDFLDNKYQAQIENISLSTNWVKYIIPIPDPSKLIEERGMFWYSAGTQETGGFGYTFWIDDLKFEKLGTIGQPQPAIQNGQDDEVKTFIGTTINLAEGGLTQTFNLASGINQTVITAPAYFNWTSTDSNVAQVDENGIVSIVGPGTAVIKGSLAGVEALGSLTINSVGAFDAAPIPTRDATNVISIFSDAYTNVPVDYYNGFFAPYQTTQGGAPPIDVNGDFIINYTDLNFVGIGTFQDVSSINITDMTYLHVDIKVNEAIDPSDYIKLQLINSVGNNEISGEYSISASELEENQWASFDVNLSDFSGLTARNQIGLLFFVSDATISNIYVDNIYYYK